MTVSEMKEIIPVDRARRREDSWDMLHALAVGHYRDGTKLGKCPLTQKALDAIHDTLSHDLDEPDWLERQRNNTTCKHNNIVCNVR